MEDLMGDRVIEALDRLNAAMERLLAALKEADDTTDSEEN